MQDPDGTGILTDPFQFLRHPVPVLSDQVSGCVDDRFAAPIIVLQSDHPVFAKAFRKIVQTFRRGASKSINTLILIPHQEQALRVTCQHHQDLVLDGRAVLHFVHTKVVEPILKSAADLLAFFQDPISIDQKIIEVHLSIQELILFVRMKDLVKIHSVRDLLFLGIFPDLIHHQSDPGRSLLRQKITEQVISLGFHHILDDLFRLRQDVEWFTIISPAILPDDP